MLMQRSAIQVETTFVFVFLFLYSSLCEESPNGLYRDKDLYPAGMQVETKQGSIHYEGFVIRSGEWRVKPVYSEVHPFHNGLARAKKDGYWYFINSAGASIMPARFTNLPSNFSDNLASVKIGSYYKYINSSGKVVIDLPLVKAGSFSVNRAVIRLDGNVYDGIINEHGAIVASTKYRGIGDFSHGLALAFYKNMAGYVGLSGDMVIPFKYSYGLAFTEGLACVADNSGICGYIDTKGNLQIDHKFNEAMAFSEGLAAVKTAEKWSFINKKGNVVFTTPYEIESSGFRDGYLRISHKNFFGFIGDRGNVVVPPIFQHVVYLGNGVARFDYDRVDRTRTKTISLLSEIERLSFWDNWNN